MEGDSQLANQSTSKNIMQIHLSAEQRSNQQTPRLGAEVRERANQEEEKEPKAVGWLRCEKVNQRHVDGCARDCYWNVRNDNGEIIGAARVPAVEVFPFNYRHVEGN
jgi:hypothetical protein